MKDIPTPVKARKRNRKLHLKFVQQFSAVSEAELQELLNGGRVLCKHVDYKRRYCQTGNQNEMWSVLVTFKNGADSALVSTP